MKDRIKKEIEKTNIKGVRLIVAGTAIFFVVFVLIRLFFDETKTLTPLLPSSTTMFVALWAIIILFSLTFLFILIRNLIKLYYKRKQGQEGGLFKNKLVFFFVGFSIVPTLLLFIFATDLINRGIDKWFQQDIDLIMNQISELEKSYYEKAKDDLRHFSRIIAEEIKNNGLKSLESNSALFKTIKRKMMEYNLDIINIYLNHEEVASFFDPIIPLQEYRNLPLEIVYGLMGNRDMIQVDELKQGRLIRNGIAFDAPTPNDKVLVIAGKYYPENYISNLKTLSTMVKKYNLLKGIKNPVKTTYQLLFIFITILIIFSASWLGLYLAKDISVPIEKVVAAASEVGKGNLDIHVDYTSQDEFNTLIREFNHMVSELKENRNRLDSQTIELEHRRSLTENILRNITTGVIALGEDGTIININQAAEKLLSLEIGNIINQHFSKAIDSNLYKDLYILIEKAFKSHFKLIEKEVDVKIKGKILNFAIKITQVREPVSNKFSGILVVLTDLTELIKAQKMLVWREVAKRIAHEIKNPLTPIQISSQRIQKAMELPDEKFRKVVDDSLNILLQELDSIKKLAEEFSNFARLPEVKFSRGDINETLEKVVSVYNAIYPNIDFSVSLDVEIPVNVMMDYEQMKRIFVNIIDNAIQAMKENGKVEIVTRYDKQSQFIAIEIADNGPGISDDDKQKLFIPYFSRKSEGTGLGLAIAHNVIEEHNGQISVVDNIPLGARFIIEIPA